MCPFLGKIEAEGFQLQLWVAHGPRRTVRDPESLVPAFSCLRKVHITLRLLVGRLVGKIIYIYNLLNINRDLMWINGGGGVRHIISLNYWVYFVFTMCG